MATAGLRRAGAGAGRAGRLLRAASRRAKNRKLLFHGAAVALGATHRLARSANELFEVIKTATAIVFEDRQSSSLTLGISNGKFHISHRV